MILRKIPMKQVRHKESLLSQSKTKVVLIDILMTLMLMQNFDGIEGIPQGDSGALFAMIFGSEKFEPLLGELQLSSQMQVGEGS